MRSRRRSNDLKRRGSIRNTSTHQSPTVANPTGTSGASEQRGGGEFACASRTRPRRADLRGRLLADRVWDGQLPPAHSMPLADHGGASFPIGFRSPPNSIAPALLVSTCGPWQILVALLPLTTDWPRLVAPCIRWCLANLRLAFFSEHVPKLSTTPNSRLLRAKLDKTLCNRSPTPTRRSIRHSSWYSSN